ncbi:MAG: DnaD domain protein [Bacilli bacterium]|nr:DnaD domain protein [Bacilli bacterium]
MNTKIINILKEKPLIIPKVLFNNYKKLNITPEEMIIIIYLINTENSNVYNPLNIAKELDIDKYKVMELINNLSEKNNIEIKVEKNEQGLSEEYIYLDSLYNKLFNILIEEEQETININNKDLFSLFETELGRTLSPMECEIIKEWINNYSEEMIKEALKEAIYNNVRNLKYIDRILYTWKNKGISTKEDIINDKKNYRKQVDTSELFDYNWLEEDNE